MTSDRNSSDPLDNLSELEFYQQQRLKPLSEKQKHINQIHERWIRNPLNPRLDIAKLDSVTANMEALGYLPPMEDEEDYD